MITGYSRTAQVTRAMIEPGEAVGTKAPYAVEATRGRRRGVQAAPR